MLKEIKTEPRSRGNDQIPILVNIHLITTDPFVKLRPSLVHRLKQG